jgi:chemotaxis protein histidine kinase CheA
MAEEDDDVEFIKPPNVIKSKVKEGGPGAVDAETLERAETVIAEETESYLVLVKEDMKKLHQSVAALKQSLSEPQKSLEEIFFVTHKIKGQAGSFGYDLLTQIADRLCRIIEYLDDVKPKEMKVIELCVLAMQLVVARSGNVADENESKALLEGLDLVIVKFFPEQTAAANAAVQAAAGN